MSCTSPLYRIPIGSKNFNLLIPSDQSKLKNHGVFLRYEALKAYESLPMWDSDSVQVLRCGQCGDCRLAYSRDWAIRCSLEAECHEHNYFVTLTYDDLTLPRGEFVDYNGDVFDSSLVRRDIQLFIKNLREWERTQNNNTNVKVFYCGEYGGLTSRPHFHICLFGVSEIPDLTFSYKKGQYNYYKSLLYEGFWSVRLNGVKVLRGFVDISDVSFDSIAYTARYVFKKQQGIMKKDFLESYNALDPNLRPTLRVQPFIGMSLKPGIGSDYYEKNKFTIHKEDLVKYQKKYKLFKSRPLRYYDKLFERENPEDFADLKRRRLRGSIAAKKMKHLLVSESELSRLKHESDILNAKEKKYHVRGL